MVQSSIVRLRKVLGREVIQTVPEGYRLTLPSHEIDACAFERLVERAREQLLLGQAERAAYTLDDALQMWRGRPLGELAEWERGRNEADRLVELRRDAEELRCEAGLVDSLDAPACARWPLDPAAEKARGAGVKA